MARLFGPDYDHAAIGRWLRRQARLGFQRGDDEYSRRYVDSCTCGVNRPEPPDSISLIFTRDSAPEYVIGWHLSVCCVTDRSYRDFVPEEAAHWLDVLFGPYKERALPQPLEDRSAFGIEKDVRHWVLECAWTNRTDPAVELEGLDGGAS